MADAAVEALEEAGARDETILFDSESLRLGVGRPFFADGSFVLGMGVTIERAFFLMRVLNILIPQGLHGFD